MYMYPGGICSCTYYHKVASKTDVPFFSPFTHITRDVAAPMKLAVASFATDERLSAKSPPTTQQVATIDTNRRAVALPSCRAVLSLR